MYTKEEKPIVLKKGTISITLALGLGKYNPDETKNLSLKGCIYKPWLKFENKWYFITIGWKYNSLKDIEKYFKTDCYTEEQFLEKIMEHI